MYNIHDNRGCLPLVRLGGWLTSCHGITSALCEPLLGVHVSRSQGQGPAAPCLQEQAMSQFHVSA